MMRIGTILLMFAFVTTTRADDAPTAVTPAEAAKKVDEKIVLEMEVKSAGGKSNYFLNSEADHKDEKNFTVFIPKDAVEKFTKAKIENPAEFFKGKTIQVTGQVTLYNKKPQIKVEDPEQIKVVEKK